MSATTNTSQSGLLDLPSEILDSIIRLNIEPFDIIAKVYGSHEFYRAKHTRYTNEIQLNVVPVNDTRSLLLVCRQLRAAYLRVQDQVKTNGRRVSGFTGLCRTESLRFMMPNQSYLTSYRGYGWGAADGRNARTFGDGTELHDWFCRSVRTLFFPGEKVLTASKVVEVRNKFPRLKMVVMEEIENHSPRTILDSCEKKDYDAQATVDPSSPYNSTWPLHTNWVQNCLRRAPWIFQLGEFGIRLRIATRIPHFHESGCGSGFAPYTGVLIGELVIGDEYDLGWRLRPCHQRCIKELCTPQEQLYASDSTKDMIVSWPHDKYFDQLAMSYSLSTSLPQR